jgi:TonB family protein
VRDAAGVEVRTGYFKVLHRTAVEYPAEARRKGISGDVVVAVVVNAQGDVTDAKVISGTQSLRKPVLESVLSWHFSMDPVEVSPGSTRPVPSSFEVGVRFQASATVTGEPSPQATPEHKSMVVDRIDLSQLPPALRERVGAALAIRSGEVLTPERFEEITKKLDEIDRHVRMRGSIKNNETAMDLQFTLTGDPPMAPNRIRVGGNVQAVNLLQKVTPKYPAEAKAALVQGVVKLQAVIGKDGTIQTLDLISGAPELVPSAMEAVKQWVYKPTLLNGNPVEVVTQIDVNYTLMP